MRASFVLNKDIQCETICQQVQKLVTQFQKHSQDLSGAVLVIDIVNITESTDGLIPKLTYQSDCNS